MKLRAFHLAIRRAVGNVHHARPQAGLRTAARAWLALKASAGAMRSERKSGTPARRLRALLMLSISSVAIASKQASAAAKRKWASARPGSSFPLEAGARAEVRPYAKEKCRVVCAGRILPLKACASAAERRTQSERSGSPPQQTRASRAKAQARCSLALGGSGGVAQTTRGGCQSRAERPRVPLKV